MLSRRSTHPRRFQGIEFRHLAALKAVAEEASFNRAAVRLGYTQPAISQQIRALERAAGHRLIERRGGSGPIALTEAGQLLLTHAEAIGARLAAATADLVSLGEGRSSVVRVGALQSIGDVLIPTAMKEFRRLRPDIHVDLTELPNDVQLLRLLESAELDAAFVNHPLPPGPFDVSPLLYDDYVLVVRRGSEIVSRSAAMMLPDLAALPLMGLKSCRTCEPLLAFARSQGVDLEFAWVADDARTLQGLVAADCGVAILPRLAAEPLSDSVELVDLEHLGLPVRTIAIASHRDRLVSEAPASFVEVSMRIASNLARAMKARRQANAA